MKSTVFLTLASILVSLCATGCTSDPIRRVYGEPVSADPYADVLLEDVEYIDTTEQDTDLPDVADDVTPDVTPDIAEDTTPDTSDVTPPDDVEDDADNPDGVRVKMATFNVRRFFDTICDSGACGEGDFEEVLSPEEFNERADELAEAIRTINPDIINLQEIESQENLNALQDRLGADYQVAIHGETSFAGSMDVAVLGRGSVLESTRHRDERIPDPSGGTTTFTREFLEVHVNISGKRVITFATHFKSKSNDDPNRRLAEARAARSIIIATRQDHPDALIVLGGDLNDTPDSPPLNALEEGGLLYRVTSTLEQDWTSTFAGSTIAIDHLYLSTGSMGSVIEDSVTIHREGRGGWGGSDHSAVSADFLIPNE